MVSPRRSPYSKACADKPKPATYDVRPNEVSPDELNSQLSSLSGIDRTYAPESEHTHFEGSDRANGARMAQIIRRSLQREVP